MFHVNMFGYLALNYKQDLLDPTDKPPSLVKTILKIQDAIFTFFKEGNKLVYRACGLSMAEILDNCFPDRSENPGNGYSTVANLIFDPLLKFL
jgi:hypothetical protein